jgi:hypothetical protein
MRDVNLCILVLLGANVIPDTSSIFVESAYLMYSAVASTPRLILSSRDQADFRYD